MKHRSRVEREEKDEAEKNKLVASNKMDEVGQGREHQISNKKEQACGMAWHGMAWHGMAWHVCVQLWRVLRGCMCECVPPPPPVHPTPHTLHRTPHTVHPTPHT